MKYRKKGEVGKVINIKNNIAIVSMTRNEACQKCGACSHGHKSEEMILEAKNLCNAKIGDKVVIDLASSDFLKATFIMYGLPLILLFTGFFLGYYAFSKFGYESLQEPIGVLSGLIFMSISYIWIKSKEERWKSQNYHPAAVEIVKD
ncbi:MAG TPA: SoxR reducing system RseC family protein [Defluviitaleaceae bacterium]|jgi:sigma-E factor negative regulatory protein RseC|nr:SoxR reducing system RseC family protein [Candidatus Epulonipiscium sp.]HOA81350.1 SoxR reducing system RseC family protein [Defluviitaleaceae bacterium]